ncbi:MAG TPA: DUF2304 domain-containing protein [Propionicimonas sp.]|jgi:hypothetical protein
MWIKVILIVAILVLAAAAMRAPRGARHVALRRIGLLVFSLFAITSVLFPDLWNWLARLLGVGRGTDLLLYALVLAFLGYVATSYQRFRGLETQITRLARRIALDEAGVRPVSTSVVLPPPGGNGTPGDVVEAEPGSPTEDPLDTRR